MKLEIQVLVTGVVGPNTLNLVPDPDPGFWLNWDPGLYLYYQF